MSTIIDGVLVVKYEWMLIPTIVSLKLLKWTVFTLYALFDFACFVFCVVLKFPTRAPHLLDIYLQMVFLGENAYEKPLLTQQLKKKLLLSDQQYFFETFTGDYIDRSLAYWAMITPKLKVCSQATYDKLKEVQKTNN